MCTSVPIQTFYTFDHTVTGPTICRWLLFALLGHSISPLRVHPFPILATLAFALKSLDPLLLSSGGAGVCVEPHSRTAVVAKCFTSDSPMVHSIVSRQKLDRAGAG
jgi:hypothetical protein